MRAHVLVRSLHCSSGTNCSSYTRITEICHTNMRNATCYKNYVVTCFLFRSVSWMTERSSRSIKARSSYTTNSPKLLMEAELFRSLPVHLVRKTGSLPVTFKQRSLLKAWCPLFFFLPLLVAWGIKRKSNLGKFFCLKENQTLSMLESIFEKWSLSALQFYWKYEILRFYAFNLQSTHSIEITVRYMLNLAICFLLEMNKLSLGSCLMEGKHLNFVSTL